MKVRFEIETKDIKGAMRFRKNGVEFLIGYRAELSSERRYCLIDLRDGAVFKAETKAGIAKTLTDGRYEPLQIEVQGEAEDI